MTKTFGPAAGPDTVGDVDVVLLSHDHHKDNLDDAGRELLARVPRVLTTREWSRAARGGRDAASQLDERGHRSPGRRDRVGPVDIAVLFAGGAQMPYLGDAYLTLPSAGAVRAAQLLEARAVIPLHFDGWALSPTADRRCAMPLPMPVCSRG